MEFEAGWNVKHNIQSRLKALYTELPMPLELAVAEHAVNEFFACLILDKTGETITVRKVYDLVGGDNNKVAARLKMLRPYLKTQQVSDDSALAALKKQIEKQVRTRLELELIEQENDYLDQISALNESAQLREKQLSQENAGLNGRLLAMASQLDDQKVQLSTQSEQIAELNKSLMAITIKSEKSDSAVVVLKEKNVAQILEIDNQKQASKKLVEAYSERASVQQSVIEHGQMIQNQLMKELAELNEQNQALTKQLETKDSLLLIEQKQSREKEHVISAFNQQEDMAQLIKDALGQALAPADGFAGHAAQLQEMLKAGVNDVSGITRSINSLETQMLNVFKDLGGLINKKLSGPDSNNKEVNVSGWIIKTVRALP